jgi:hypothetical protein
MENQWTNGRRFGLDWLRIAAFGLLIFYHIGMFFVPWDWHVKTARPIAWIELPMLALNPWRLTLLFVVSGIASRVLLGKVARPGGFARQRTARLLIPLLAGMILFVAPQPWVELQEKAGYEAGFWTFWTEDYFEFGASTGLILPTYNHLWFVAYLWLYTLLLSGLAALPARWRTALQQGFERVFAGWRVFVVPALFLLAARVALYPAYPPTNALVGDWYNHAVYAGAFFLGAGLARAERLWRPIVAAWPAAALAALAGYGVRAGILVQEGEPGSALAALARAGFAVQAWGAILALLGFAQRHLHRDGPVRRYLTDAIFPYYIVHQTIIVLCGFWLKPLGLGAGGEFVVLVLATLAGCAATYEIARRIAFLRPIMGLKPRPAPARPQAAAAGLPGEALPSRAGVGPQA